MLSTFLSQLQTYFSKYFVIGNFFPVLAFAFVNGLFGYLIFDPWRKWVDSNLLNASAGREAFLTTSMIVGIVLAAYVLSSLGTFLRGLLEGKWWAPVAGLFIPAQNSRREWLLRELDTARNDIIDLRDTSQWEKKLQDARAEGKSQHQGQQLTDAQAEPLDEALKALERNRSKDEPINVDDFDDCRSKLEVQLHDNDADFGQKLDQLHQRLIALIRYADDRAYARYARLQNELNSNFGAQEVAPTKMGNVANTIQGYALRRYRCNLEAVWSNLQRTVQKDEKAQTALLEAKTQLDFLVACCWLTLLSSAIWIVILYFVEPSRLGFLMAALGGPLLAYLWYRAAAEQYRSFADVAMTTLDLFRFDLLRDLRLGIPSDVEDERVVWENFDKLTTYGESQNFRYDQSTKHESTP